MSHGKERHDKHCLNCGTLVAGRFCQECGQENIEPQETFWGLVTHFFNDITHFDGKFFRTVRLLFQKPGFLSKEYLEGRRQQYLNPIRMYIFTSALFFLIFFSITKINLGNPESSTRSRNLDRLRAQAGNLAGTKDSAQLLKTLDSIFVLQSDSVKTPGGFSVEAADQKYRTKEEYLTAQEKLPESKRDGWFSRKFKLRTLHMNEDYSANPKAFLEKLADGFLHQFPKILFLSLPIFALTFQLLYRRKRHIWYTGHGIFSIHLYIFSFLLLLAFFLFRWMKNFGMSGFWSILQFVLFLYFYYYTYKAMRYFYGDGRGKTLAKLVLHNFISLFTFTFLTVFFFLFITFFG